MARDAPIKYSVFFLNISNFVILLAVCVQANNFRPPIVVKAAVILTENATGLMYDMYDVRPALEIAFKRSLEMYNVLYEVYWIPYSNACHQGKALGKSTEAILFTPFVDVIIGPGCSADLLIVCELTTYFPVPILTGAAELVDTTFMYPYLIRFSFNTYSLWRIFVEMMKFYQWSNIVLIRDCCDYPKNVTAQGFINILKDENIQPYEHHFLTGSLNTSSKIERILGEASRFGRIFVLSMDSVLLRRFMLIANRLGMCEGEYAFVALDLYQNDIIGTGRNGWQQNDFLDMAAKHAYASLFILTLMNKQSLPEYQKFEKAVKNQTLEEYGNGRPVGINYHTGAFHDSVIMFASTVNLTVSEGGSVDKEHIIPLTQRFWGIKWEGGASGKVYIDPFGDRSDDHSLYHMESEESGEFVVIANYFGYKKVYEEVANISWPRRRKRPPVNRPHCGYMGEDLSCQVKGMPITEITVGVALGILLIAGITGFLMYKRAKEEANLSSMDWLAQWTELTYNEAASQKSQASVATVKSGNTESTKRHDMATLFTASTSFAKTHQVLFRGNLVLLRMCEKRKIELTKDVREEIKGVRIVTHENLMRFVGALLGPDQTAVLLEFCSKGNLQNLLNNDAFKLDDLFNTSLINDIIKGMLYIHSSALQVHGRLNSRCCYIDSRFVLKIGDYGLAAFYDNPPPFSPDNEYFTTLLWKAPEVISHHTGRTQEADAYSFGIIMQEIIVREEPYAMYPLGAEESVRRVMKNTEPPFRPKVKPEAAPPAMIAMMERCWAQNPADRPRFQEIRGIMRQISRNYDQQGNLMDTLLKRMEQYAQNLESLVEEKTHAFLEEKRKSDQLLNQLLPKTVAEQLKGGQPVLPESYESVTIYFSDIVGFTTMSSESTPMQIVDFLNDLYICFDGTITQHDVYKVETIGDSYMCVSGLPVRNGLEHAAQIARMALSLLGNVSIFKIRHRPHEQLKLRIGMHSGPCVAGVVGLTMPRYCLFGDTVNTASRMESTGEALKIQISSITKTLLDAFKCFNCQERGEILVKGKGHIRTFWLLQENEHGPADQHIEKG